MNFLNPAYGQQFDRNGFVKIPALVNNKMLCELQNLYKTTLKGKSGGFMYSNYHDLSYAENEAIKQEIVSVCSGILEGLLNEYRIVGASFIIKGAGEHSDSRIHQDWSIVDESQYKSQILWIPLVDVNEHNGCLQVISGSHLWFKTIRSESISSLFLKFNVAINKFLTPVPLRMGDAAVFSMKVFHGSRQNLSTQERPAAVITLIDKKARYVYYHREMDGSVKVLDCNDAESYRKTYEYCKGRSQTEATVLMENNQYKPIDEFDFFKKLYSVRMPLGILFLPLLILFLLKRKLAVLQHNYK